MPVSLVIASTHVNASINNDSKQLKECETAREYKGKKIGQVKAWKALVSAASCAPTNPIQLSPHWLHNGHTVTSAFIRPIRAAMRQIQNTRTSVC